MKSTLKSVTYAFLFLVSLAQLTSCSKDSDLLTEYVLNEDLAALSNLVVDDSFAITNGQPTVLNVLQNDQFENLNNVTIVNTTAPQNGVIIINEDQTLTYTPNVSTGENVPTTPEPTTPEPTTPEPTTPEPTTPEPTTPEPTTPEPTTPEPTTPEPTTPEPTTPEPEVVDTFEYVTEEVSPNGEISVSEGTVTITSSESKLPSSGTNVYYVTTSGNANNNGKSQATAWNLTRAVNSVKAGDIVHIKAGNYGSGSVNLYKSGSPGNHIRFVGYTNTPGDIISDKGSTFKFGNTPDANKMPMLDANNKGEGILIAGNNIELHNFQVKDYSTGIRVSGKNTILNNVVVLDMGNQSSSGYDGFGIHFMNTTNSLIQNSYIENSTAESFKIYGGANNKVSYLEVRADNATNPTDYYVVLSNTTGNIVEDSRVERTPGLSHNGHGLTIKWNAKNNIFRRCEAKYTNVEMNFSDVTDNLFENIEIIGQGQNHYQAHVHFSNGANNNTLRNVNISDVDFAFNFTDMDDGFTPSPDTDARQGGNNNRLENITVNNAKMLIRALPGTLVGGDINAFVRDNVFENCNFNNYGILANFYMRNEGNEFKNSSFKNGTEGIKLNNGSPYRTDIVNNVKFTNCTFENAPQ